MQGSRPLTSEEVQLCLNSFDGRYRLRNQALFILGLNTGFRISELISLTIRDVMPYSKISDHVTVQRSSMKNKKQSRTVVLNEICKKYIKDYLDHFKEIYFVEPEKQFYLFKSQKNENKAISSRQASGILHDVYQKNEMMGKTSTHSMRKTFAKEIHEELGSDIVRTQKALGHKQVTSTQHYLSFDNSLIDSAVKNLNIGSKEEGPHITTHTIQENV